MQRLTLISWLARHGLLLLLWVTGVLHSAHAADFLPPGEAFQAEARLQDARTIELRYRIAEGYYLYGNRFRFELQAPAPALGKPALPAGTLKQDPNFGQVETHHGIIRILLPLTASASGPLTLKAVSQGCAEAGICYPPFTHTLPIALASSSSTQEVATADNPFASRSVASLLGFFYLAGLGLAFTACMYPLIPILSGIIVGQGQHATHLRSFILSFAYVQGLAMAYAIAGVAAGLSGTLISSSLQNPWVLGGTSLFFVLMAGSMFGLYSIQLPSALQSRLNDQSNRLHGGRIGSVFLMGILSALIIGPCVAPPLAIALGYIGTTGDMLLGGSSLYVMALGMGTPLLVVGAFGAHLLPRAGAWMNSVKQVFGTVMLAVAIYLAGPILPAWLSMLAWAGLLIVSAIFLHALDPLPNHASGWRKLWKGMGIVALLYGAALLLGVLAGSRDALQPLQGLIPAASQPSATESGRLAPLPFQRVADEAALDRQLALARGKTVMVDFYADWCVSCKELERFTFSDPAVRQQLQHSVLLQVDVTANSAADQALLRRFGLFGPPAILFYNADGKLLPQRAIGFVAPETFLNTLRQWQG